MNSTSTQHTNKIEKSHLPEKTKEILPLFMSLFNDIMKDKDLEVAELKEQVNSLESKI